MLDWISEADSAAILGLLGGVILGLGARIGRFCTLGAIEEAIYSSDDRRLRMWWANPSRLRPSPVDLGERGREQPGR